MKKLRLSDGAREFIRQEAIYLRNYSKAAATRFRILVETDMRNLSQYPNIGSSDQRYPVPGVRRKVTGNYIFYYSISAENIDILYIRHCRQNEPWVAVEDDEDFEP